MVDINVKYGHFFLGDLADSWNPANIIAAPTATSFEMDDPLTGRKIVISGSNFQGGAIGTAPTIGVVNSISYYNHDGSPAWTINSLNVSLADFEKAIGSASYTNPASLDAFFGQTGFSTGNGINFHGNLGNDTINGGYGNDVIHGGLGSDVISGGFGRDTLSGGGVNSANPSEMDVLTYAGETGGLPVTVNLDRGLATDTNGFTDHISGFEMIIGTAAADTFIAGNRNVFHGFVGGLGNDTFEGGNGHFDAVFYDQLNTAGVTITVSAGNLIATGTGIGTDTLTNIDIIVGSAANDTITGSGADEVICGGNGLDTLNGGGGNDTLDFSREHGTYGAVVNLGRNIDIDTYHSGLGASSAYAEQAIGFENVIGSAHDDFITGSTDANRLVGGDGADEIDGLAGADVILGGSGNDWIVGGAGADILSGGGGSDVFVFAKGDTGERTNGRQDHRLRCKWRCHRPSRNGCQ